MEVKEPYFYKGYTGIAEFDEEDHYYAGRVIGLRRTGIIFEGDTLENLRKDFEEGIDYYLNSCKEDGIKPEKPKKRKLRQQMSPELYSQVANQTVSLAQIF